MNESERNKPENESQEWQNCPQGAVGQVVGGLRRQTQLKTARKWGGVSALLLIVLVGGFSVYSQLVPPDKSHGKYSCAQVYAFMEQLLRGDLDQAIVNQIEIHLRACPRCQAALEDKDQLYRQEHGEEPKFKFDHEPFRAQLPPYRKDNLLVVR